MFIAYPNFADEVWRKSGECGNKVFLPDGSPTECDPGGDRPCCSREGKCGNTTNHCTCVGCIDYREVKEWRDAGYCSQKQISHTNIDICTDTDLYDHTIQSVPKNVFIWFSSTSSGGLVLYDFPPGKLSIMPRNILFL